MSWGRVPTTLRIRTAGPMDGRTARQVGPRTQYRFEGPAIRRPWPGSLDARPSEKVGDQRAVWLGRARPAVVATGGRGDPRSPGEAIRGRQVEDRADGAGDVRGRHRRDDPSEVLPRKDPGHRREVRSEHDRSAGGHGLEELVGGREALVEGDG